MRLSGSGLAKRMDAPASCRGGESRRSQRVPLHFRDGLGRHQLGAQGAEEIGVGNQEILDLAVFRDLGRWVAMLSFPFVEASNYLLSFLIDPRIDALHIPLPGIQFVPASSTPAIAANSTVRATRSSGSRLCT